MASERSPLDRSTSDPIVLVPIKDFRQAKHRLSERLGQVERRDLARKMATRVLRAAGALEVRVVCNDDEVAAWARAHGAGVEWVDIEGLNPAVQMAVDQLADDIDTVLIAHADLPLATSLRGIARPGAVAIVPDRHHDGTNVLAIPRHSGFRFHYGPGSLHAHISEALRLGLDLDIRQIPALQFDVDTPADLDEDTSL